MDTIPKPEELSATITLELNSRGGHVGFVEGYLPWSPKYWLEERVPDFLARYL
jgi:predicted alpha/beta-fold hydrolase